MPRENLREYHGRCVDEELGKSEVDMTSKYLDLGKVFKAAKALREDIEQLEKEIKP